MLSKPISTQPERAQPIQAPHYSIPLSPIFLIERPPRHTQDVTITLKTKGEYLSVKRVI